MTRKPSGEFKLRALAGISNFGGYRGEMHLDLPETANLSFKLDAVFSVRGGTTDNPLAGAEDFNEFDRRGLAAQLVWAPIDGFSASYGFDISYDATPMTRPRRCLRRLFPAGRSPGHRSRPCNRPVRGPRPPARRSNSASAKRTATG